MAVQEILYYQRVQHSTSWPTGLTGAWEQLELKVECTETQTKRPSNCPLLGYFPAGRTPGSEGEGEGVGAGDADTEGVGSGVGDGEDAANVMQHKVQGPPSPSHPGMQLLFRAARTFVGM